MTTVSSSSSSSSSSSWDVTVSVKFKSLSRCSAALNRFSASTHHQKIKIAEVFSHSSFHLKGCSNGNKQIKVFLASANSKASEESSTLSSENSESTQASNELPLPDFRNDVNPGAQISSELQDSLLKRSPLTVRENLRTARMMSKYTETKPPKQEFGSKVLDALRESDRGKKRSGLPEAPNKFV